MNINDNTALKCIQDGIVLTLGRAISTIERPKDLFPHT